MESLKPYQELLIPLTTLASRVEAFAALCLPDFVYSDDNTRNLTFIDADISQFVGDALPLKVAALSIDTNGEQQPYAFTRWSRGQLLSHLGAREKWFETVMLPQEVSELNIRRHALSGFMLRTMTSFDSPGLNLVRGIVSSKYADLPDTTIMKALVDLIPSGFVLRGYSGKTDRAFYAYIIAGEKIGLPGTSFSGFPGIVVRNSEVGYTSLWITPILWLTRYTVPIVLRKHVVLRRIHRGDVTTLTTKFEEALNSTKVLWGPLEEKLGKLRTISYVDENTAVHVMTVMLDRAGAEKHFTHRCEQRYRSASYLSHDAANIFEAILTGVKNEADQDAAYISAELAGAVLMQLVE